MSDMAVTYKPHRVTIDEYHRMVAAGVFDADAHVELIEGEILERVSPIHPAHAMTTWRITELLAQRLGARAMVRSQSPVTLPYDSEPQPDIAVARRDEAYWTRHPGVSEALLVVEVADGSLGSDRRKKIPLYARAGIAEVWLVDLINEIVYVHREPRNGEYTSVSVARRGDTIAPHAFPDAAIAVSDFLPPP